jgi:guanylate kinase
VGKSTIVREVLARADAAYSVSVTTRAPRAGEVDGRDYRFVDRATFDRMARGGELLEWAEVFGHGYGTPAGPVRQAVESGRTILLDIDVQGAMQVHQRLPDAMFILIVPPSDQALRERLVGRGSENGPEAERRLAAAKSELDTAQRSGIYTHSMVNDDLETAIAAVVDIIQEESAGR